MKSSPADVRLWKPSQNDNFMKFAFHRVLAPVSLTKICKHSRHNLGVRLFAPRSPFCSALLLKGGGRSRFSINAIKNSSNFAVHYDPPIKPCDKLRKH